MGEPGHTSRMSQNHDYLVAPDPRDPRLTERVSGTDQAGLPVDMSVTVERPLALFLNSREIVTLMTIGDYPECLAIGYLLNQNMLRPDDAVTSESSPVLPTRMALISDLVSLIERAMARSSERRS